MEGVFVMGSAVPSGLGPWQADTASMTITQTTDASVRTPVYGLTPHSHTVPS